MKVLQHFLPIPCLQRLFMCRKITPNIKWHRESNAIKTGVMRHPLDSEQGKFLDEKFTVFG